MKQIFLIFTIIAFSSLFFQVICEQYKTTCYCTEEDAAQNFCMNWECDQNRVTTVSCFPGNSKVRVSETESILLKDLQVGQKIITLNENGQIIEDEIIAFLDKNTNIYEKFLKISYQISNNTIDYLQISHEHLIFSSKSGKSVQAKQLNINDNLIILNPVNNQLEKGVIINIEEIFSIGIYSPLTKSGTLIVDETLCSNYASFKDHSIAHNAFAPYRYLYQYSPYLFKSLISQQNNEGIFWYADVLMKISQYLPSKFNYKNTNQ